MSERQPTILLVDDDAGMRLTLSRILTAKGYHTLVARNGSEAVQIAQDYAFDLALVDYRMTGANGGQVCAALSRIRPEAWVYMMTAHVTAEAAESAVANGASGILYKPVNVDKLLELIADRVTATSEATATERVHL